MAGGLAAGGDGCQSAEGDHPEKILEQLSCRRHWGEGGGGGKYENNLKENPEEIQSLVEILQTAAPGRVWLGVSMPHRGDDLRRLKTWRRIAQAASVPLLATNDVLYHAPERRELQDIVTCIREHVTLDDAGRLLEPNAERHLKSPKDMAALFAEAPQAIAETLRFADRISFSLDQLRYNYPDEPVPKGKTAQQHLEDLAWEGAAERYPGMLPDKVRDVLEKELHLIAGLEIAPYFLTVHDIVGFAKRRGILCQGRGSAANSAVCYVLGITAVDPMQIDLLFERFVSAERREPPDIDVDFEHERREEVIQDIYHALWPPARRARRHRHLLSPAQRHPRSGKSLRPHRRRHRRACLGHMGKLGQPPQGKRSAPGRARSA